MSYLSYLWKKQSASKCLLSPTHPIYSLATSDPPCISVLPMQLVSCSTPVHKCPWNGGNTLQISGVSLSRLADKAASWATLRPLARATEAFRFLGIADIGRGECQVRNLSNLYIQSLILETTSKVFEKKYICTRFKANQTIYNKLNYLYSNSAN